MEILGHLKAYNNHKYNKEGRNSIIEKRKILTPLNNTTSTSKKFNYVAPQNTSKTLDVKHARVKSSSNTKIP